MSDTGFTIGLGYNQGWDMTSLGFSAPTTSPLDVAAAQVVADRGVTGSFTSPTTSAASVASDSKAMLWLSIAGVVLAAATYFRGK